jgi:hypothetical protein
MAEPTHTAAARPHQIKSGIRSGASQEAIQFARTRSVHGE